MVRIELPTVSRNRPMIGKLLSPIVFFLMSIVILMASNPSYADVVGQIVRIRLPGAGRTLQLAEVSIVDSTGRNVALQGRTRQSSTFGFGSSSKAIDGRTEGNYFGGSVTHTQSENAPWWEVDLNQYKTIKSITVFNRSDCCQDRLSGAVIEILDARRQVLWMDTRTLANGVRNKSFSVTPQPSASDVIATKPTPTPPPSSQAGSATVNARYVRIELPGYRRQLSLAEVQVLSAGQNIALNRSASQSSQFYSAHAQLAVDGNTDGNFWHGSVMHTDNLPNSWWEVDLGTQSPINGIVIYNRTDCCTDRIAPGVIKLLDNQRRQVYVDDTSLSSASARYDVPLRPAMVVALPPPVAPSPNLLQNAGFNKATNGVIPDFWDIHQIAALNNPGIEQFINIDDSVTSPIAGTRPVRLVGNAASVGPTIFAPTKFVTNPAPGTYTYSIYIKADRPGSLIEVMSGWQEKYVEMTRSATPITVSTSWQRYAVTFQVPANMSYPFQPLVFLRSTAIYHVAAPQLEPGQSATVFKTATMDDPNAENALRELNLAKTSLQDIRANMVTPLARSQVSASFEYNYYTNDTTARLGVEWNGSVPLLANIECKSTTVATASALFTMDVALSEKFNQFEIPVQNFANGSYECTVRNTANSNSLAAASLEKLAVAAHTVRINHFKRYVEVDRQPFFMIGMFGVGSFNVPDAWYFEDLTAHGINTVMFTRPPDANGDFDLTAIRRFLQLAAHYNIKAIVGIAGEGNKPSDWNIRLSGMVRMINTLKDDPNIIGWWIVDEPDERTWTNSDLQQARDAVKRADPYRLAYINWSYSAVRRAIGDQPVGTLASSDMYSSDAYPFTIHGIGMSGFSENAMRVAETARRFHKPAHSWLQVFGGMTAWREPIAEELEYMAHLSLVYGDSYSFFYVRPHASRAWEKIGVLNRRSQQLATELFLSNDAEEALEPVVQGSFIYSVYKKGSRLYVIATHNQNEQENVAFNLQSLVGNNATLPANDWFDGSSVQFSNGTITDRFMPYESKVYVLGR